MGQNLKIILIILLIFVILTVPSTAVALNPIDAGAQMISNGLDSWTVNLGDKFMNASSFTNQSATERGIISILTFTYDPFKNPWILESRDTTALIYTILVFLFMFTGAAYVYIHTASPSVAQNIEWLVGNLKYFHLQNYLKNLVFAVLFIVGVYFGYWLLLLFNVVLSELVLTSVLDSIIPKPDNIIMYFFMAIATFILSVFMAWRMLVIGIGAAYILVLAGMYLFDPLRDIAVKIFGYIVTMIFMQVILISVAGTGVMIIQWLPFPEKNKYIFYLALIFGLVLLAFILVIGGALFMKGSKAIRLVA